MASPRGGLWWLLRTERMRLLDYFPHEAEARAARDLLEVEGIASECEADGPQWALWVADDDHLERARGLVRDLRAAPPGTVAGAGIRAAAAARRAQAAIEDRRYARRVVDGRLLAARPSRGVLTLALALVCVAVALLTRLGEDGPVTRLLLISELTWGRGFSPRQFLAEVRAGEVWRLLTPIFLHFHILHILFNLLWLLDLGNIIEGRQGTLRLALLVVCTALPSNLVQYWFGGPLFGGMSGVVYGLLGYVWMLGRHRPDLGLGLRKETIVMMLIWLGVCAAGVVGNIANWAHGVGLVAGMAFGRWAAARD